MVARAKQLENQPVVFVAVNSGNSADTVKSYLDRVKVDWPAIVDKDRTFEKACGVGVLSLQNIWQTAIITADGALRYGKIQKVDYFLKQAKWNIDPTGMPRELKPAWRALEFGDLRQGVSLLNFAREKVSKTNVGFLRLTDLIDRNLAVHVEAADALVKAKRFAEANVRYQWVLREFEGYQHAGVAKSAAAIKRLLPGLLRDVMSSLEQSDEPVFERLQKEMVRMLANRLRAADALAERGRAWEATKAYERILVQYDGLETPLYRETKAALKAMKKRDDVKLQFAARRSFDRALTKLKSSDPKKQHSGKAALVKLCKKYAGTEAAVKAQAILSD